MDLNQFKIDLEPIEIIELKTTVLEILKVIRDIFLFFIVIKIIGFWMKYSKTKDVERELKEIKKLLEKKEIDNQ